MDLSKLTTNPYTYCNSLPVKELSAIIEYLNDQYYNNKSIVSDSIYDLIKDILIEKEPSHPLVLAVGSQVADKMVQLPYWMGSINKIKPDTSALDTWMSKYNGPYTVSDKLDGISALYIIDGGSTALYTRGNGIIGQDITKILPFLKLHLLNVDCLQSGRIVIRGELIIAKANFAKFGDDFSNGRNIVSGIVNSKTVIASKAKYIEFIAYQLIYPANHTISQQLTLLQKCKFNTPVYKTVAIMNTIMLSEYLIERRANSDYDIDGIVVIDDNKYPQLPVTSKESHINPKHAFAFKMVLSDQMAESVVIDVVWTVAKDGYLIPTVHIEPLHINGVVISVCTGFNGKFIVDNLIGPGAVLQIIRSGDVIPYIKSVVTPALVAKMPDVKYKWCSNNVNVIVLDIATNKLVKLKRIIYFFKRLDTKYLSTGLLTKCIEYDSLNNIPKLLNATISDFLTVDGIKITLATKIYNSIQESLHAATLPVIMAATGAFKRGFSVKRCETLLNIIPFDKITTMDQADLLDKIIAIPGFEYKTASQFVDSIKDFKVCLSCFPQFVIDKFSKDTTISITNTDMWSVNINAVFTGIRDKELEAYIISKGGKISNTISKNTTHLINESLAITGKVAKAQQLNIPIMSLSDFKKYIYAL